MGTQADLSLGSSERSCKCVELCLWMRALTLRYRSVQGCHMLSWLSAFSFVFCCFLFLCLVSAVPTRGSSVSDEPCLSAPSFQLGDLQPIGSSVPELQFVSWRPHPGVRTRKLCITSSPVCLHWPGCHPRHPAFPLDTAVTQPASEPQ